MKPMKYAIDAAMLEAILRTAAKQFHADAETFANVGDKRSMAQFLYQANCAEQLYEELQGTGVVLLSEVEHASAHVRGLSKIEELALLRRHRTKCKHCGETQASHALEVKCPFESTLFAPEKG